MSSAEQLKQLSEDVRLCVYAEECWAPSAALDFSDGVVDEVACGVAAGSQRFTSIVWISGDFIASLGTVVNVALITSTLIKFFCLSANYIDQPITKLY